MWRGLTSESKAIDSQPPLCCAELVIMLTGAG
jgi:hypothetical protein